MEEVEKKLSQAYDCLFNIGVKGADVQNMYIAMSLIKGAYDEIKRLGENANGCSNKANKSVT